MAPRHETTHRIYHFLRNYYDQEGISPTHQEIADACYLARSGVVAHLMKLEAWGYVQFEDGKKRSLRPLKTEAELEALLLSKSKKT